MNDFRPGVKLASLIVLLEMVQFCAERLGIGWNGNRSTAELPSAAEDPNG
jgi:hypothetical protein